jgi:hypothetical protein
MVEVKKCPPGAALGAGDSNTWASRRMAGRSGVPFIPNEKEHYKYKRPDIRKRKRKERAMERVRKAEMEAFEQRERFTLIKKGE